MANPNENLDEQAIEISEEVRETVIGIAQEVTAIFAKELRNRADTINALNAELTQLKTQLAGFVNPDYGMLPVPAFLHEYVVELARARGTAPGVLMASEAVKNHFQELIAKELV